MAIRNILTSGSLCFRVFELQLKVIRKFVGICTVHEQTKSIRVALPLVTLYLF